MLSERYLNDSDDADPMNQLPPDTKEDSHILHQYIDIRQEIFKHLGIKCVYPCSLLNTVEKTVNSRCILEHRPELDNEAISQTRSFDKLYEDVIVRYKDNSTLIRLGIKNVRLEQVCLSITIEICST